MRRRIYDDRARLRGHGRFDFMIESAEWTRVTARNGIEIGGIVRGDWVHVLRVSGSVLRVCEVDKYSDENWSLCLSCNGYGHNVHGDGEYGCTGCDDSGWVSFGWPALISISGESRPVWFDVAIDGIDGAPSLAEAAGVELRAIKLVRDFDERCREARLIEGIEIDTRRQIEILEKMTADVAPRYGVQARSLVLSGGEPLRRSRVVVSRDQIREALPASVTTYGFARLGDDREIQLRRDAATGVKGAVDVLDDYLIEVDADAAKVIQKEQRPDTYFKGQR